MSPYLCHCSQDERSYLACSQDESIFASLLASLLSLHLSIMNALQFELSNRTGSLTYVRLKCKQTYSKLLYAQLFFFSQDNEKSHLFLEPYRFVVKKLKYIQISLGLQTLPSHLTLKIKFTIMFYIEMDFLSRTIKLQVLQFVIS